MKNVSTFGRNEYVGKQGTADRADGGVDCTGGWLWLAPQGSSTTGRAQGAYLSSIKTTGAKPYLLIWHDVKLASPPYGLLCSNWAKLLERTQKIDRKMA